jgi:hypothetical protein
VTALALDERWSLASVIAVPAFVVFCLPFNPISNNLISPDATQVRCVILELLLAAAAAALLHPFRGLRGRLRLGAGVEPDGAKASLQSA